jgi:hypothetical protein
MAKKDLIENVHYHVDERGNIVFSSLFLLERGYCCGNKCRNCPYSKPVKKGNTDIDEHFLHLKKQ